MENILNIAVFEPEKQSRETLFASIKRDNFSFYPLDSLDSLLEIVDELEIHVIVLPQILSDGSRCAAICLQLRSDERLASIPIVVSCSTQDRNTVETIYGAGADVVLIEPFSSSQLQCQIMALARQHRLFREQVAAAGESLSFRKSNVNAFDSVRDAIILTDPKIEPFFMNTNAHLLLGISLNASASERSAVFEQFLAHLNEYERQVPSSSKMDEPVVLSKEIRLRRADGRSFPATLRCLKVQGDLKSSAGFAIAFSDLTEVDELASRLLVAERVRTLALISSAAAQILLNTPSLGTPSEPLKFVEGLFHKAEAHCDLERIFTNLLEVIDFVTPLNAEIKVSLDKNYRVAIKSPHLYQILGHLMLCATDFSGPNSLVEVFGSSTELNDAVDVIIVAHSRRVTPYLVDDFLTNLLRGDYSRAGDGEKSTNAAFGLEAAQNIAEYYGIDVELKVSSDESFKLRLRLPVADTP